jgi:hypothetical protein
MRGVDKAVASGPQADGYRADADMSGKKRDAGAQYLNV